MNTLLTPRAAALAAAFLLGSFGCARAQGLYVGANLGTPDYNSRVNGIDGGGSGLGGKVYVGLPITPGFAIEGGYFNVGHINNASGKVKVRGVFVDGVGSYAFAPNWSVLGRIGLAQGRFHTSNGKDSSPALRLGAGLEYALSASTALRGEYGHYRFSSAFGHSANIGEFSLGVKIGF